MQTFGLLQTAFVVDPLRNDAGGWWRQTYSSAPDVALNHPSRWKITTPPVTDPVPDNCLPVGANSSQMNCATLAAAHPDNPWMSLFHFVRGLFITNETNPGKGPQLQTARAGTKLHLQARVYNYSLKPMPADTIVHARFYAQPWDVANHMPIGDSILIGEDRLSPISPFSTDDGAPLNWVLAKTTFDTTNFANQDLTFWVVVWMADGNGVMVPEIASHGLTGIPGELKALADVQTEAYSNNVGFYKSPFHVFPKESHEEPPAPGKPVIDVGKVQVSAHRVVPGHTIEVSALLSAANASAAGVTAVFYDGDPRAGGKAFAVERAPYIAAGGEHLVKALYQATTCGLHRLYIVAGKGTPTDASNRSWPVWVPCRSLGASDR